MIRNPLVLLSDSFRLRGFPTVVPDDVMIEVFEPLGCPAKIEGTLHDIALGQVKIELWRTSRLRRAARFSKCSEARWHVPDQAGSATPSEPSLPTSPLR